MTHAGRGTGVMTTFRRRVLPVAACLLLVPAGSLVGAAESTPDEAEAELRTRPADGVRATATDSGAVRNCTRTPKLQRTSPQATGVRAPRPARRDAGECRDAPEWWPFELRPPFGSLTASERRSDAAVMVGNAAYVIHRGPPPIPPELTDDRPPAEGGGFYVVHFTRPLSVEEVDELRRRGVRSAGYVPRRAWLAELDARAFELLAADPRVDAIDRYQPAYKISPRTGGPVAGTLELRAIVFSGEDPAALAEELRRLGAEVSSSSGPSPLDPGSLPDGRVRARHPATVEFRIPAERAGEIVPRVARIEGVRWIERLPRYRLASDWTMTGWVHGDSRSGGADFLRVRQAWNNGLRGEGVLLGSVDTGIDFDHAWFADPVGPAVGQEDPPTRPCPGDGPKNSPKVPFYHLAPPFGFIVPVCYDRDSAGTWLGHGTATAGLMAADPTGSDNVNIDLSSGVAPEAQIWLYDAGGSSGADIAIDAAAFSAELEAMGDAKAAAVNLSFVEDGTDGAYDLTAALLDEAAWNRASLLPVQAAGNDGSDTGGASTYTVDATGKNVVAVGGNRDDDPAVVYPYTSRGPTLDGRHKPDVLSPADNDLGVPDPDPELDETLLLLASDGDITSGNSGFLYGPEGTSLSSAVVAGAAGIVAQYFKDGYYPTGIASPPDGFDPPNHLVKAILVNSALRLTGPGISDDSRPGKDQGWGRVKLNDPLYFSQDPDTGDDARKLVAYRGFFPQGAASCPGDSEIFTFDVFNVEEELRVTLSWTDYPGDPGSPAADQIVNDLDLIVTAPDASVYLGNVFDEAGTGLSVTGGQADRLNTIENVWLAAGETLATGEYTVEVCPYAINEGARQDFSLVVTGGVAAGEKVRFGQSGYTCLDTVDVRVEDLVAAGPTVDVVVTSQTTGDSETVTLAEAGQTGVYAGTIGTAAAAGPPGVENGSLEVVDGETIEVGYLGSSDGAAIDCALPVCYAVDLGPVLRHECDHDGFADNGETIHLYLPLRNEADFPVDGTTAVLSSGNLHVTVDSDTATYGTIPAGGLGLPDADGTDDPFVITVSGAACAETAILTLTAVEGTGWDGAGCTTADLELSLERDPVALEAWDFDDGSPQGWTHVMSHGTRPGEECQEEYEDEWNTFPTSIRTHGGDYSMQLGDGSYGPLLDCSLVSPFIDVPSGGARLEFHYWMEADVYDSAQVWHGFIVEVSSDGGTSWTRLEPVQGYNATAARNDCFYAFPFGYLAPDFLELFGGDGDGSLYDGDTFDQRWAVDLTPWASQTVQVRFRFGSDEFAGGSEGLYIDTVGLVGVQCETPNVCDDGDSCTTEVCDPDAGGCQYDAEPDGTGCDDGEPCTANEECSGGVCVGSDVIACDDANPCTDDWAEDDGDGTCDDPLVDCRHENNTAPCDDANECTTLDICDEGACVGGPLLDCEDYNACTDDSCNPATGCEYVNNADPCGDPYACTEGDVCTDGQCVGIPNHSLCDDANVCTTDTCEPGNPAAQADGCVLAPVADGTTCDDASVCTDPDSCQGGLCTGDPVVCDDGAACTHDLCDDASGCYYPGIDEDEDGYDICGEGDPVDPDGLEKDCNDALPGVNPGAVEDCHNDLDDDCDGLADEEDTEGCPLCDVSGTVWYYRWAGVEPSTNPVPGVSMEMVGTELGTTSTDDNGYYEFLDILKGVVSVIPTKIGDYRNAISSLDAARVSQHRVGMITLSARQQIAADTSGNGTISSYDAALISQFRVGIIDRMPVADNAGSDWEFEPQQLNYAPLQADQVDQDFLGILYGDVTGNWLPPGSRQAGPMGSEGTKIRTGERPGDDAGSVAGSCRLWLRPSGIQFAASKRQRYVLQASGVAGLVGMDLDLRYPAEELSIVSVSTTERTRGFALIANGSNGLLRVSMYGDRPLEAGGPLLELLVERRKAGQKPGWAFEAWLNEGEIECITSP